MVLTVSILFHVLQSDKSNFIH